MQVQFTNPKKTIVTFTDIQANVPNHWKQCVRIKGQPIDVNWSEKLIKENDKPYKNLTLEGIVCLRWGESMTCSENEWKELLVPAWIILVKHMSEFPIPSGYESETCKSKTLLLDSSGIVQRTGLSDEKEAYISYVRTEEIVEDVDTEALCTNVSITFPEKWKRVCDLTDENGRQVLWRKKPIDKYLRPTFGGTTTCFYWGQTFNCSRHELKKFVVPACNAIKKHFQISNDSTTVIDI